MGIIRNIFDKFKKNTTDTLVKTDTIEEDESELLEVYSKIDKAKQLSKVMNVTIDKIEFINSLVELKEILNELIKYEGKYEFDPAPSKDLEYLESVEKEKIELLEKRIAEKESIKVSDPAIDEVRKNDILIEEPEEITEDFVCEGKSEGVCHNLQEDIVYSAICEESTVFDYKSQDEIQLENYEEVEDEIKSIDEDYLEINEETYPYRSKRFIIGGLHIYFISVAREILEQNDINIIPLMREYKISEDDLNQIICEMQETNVIDENNVPMMSLEEFERFVDIYEPGLFKCKNCVFDKKNFTDIGEIIFEEGVESVYDILPADEILDYLNIMEILKIISYDDYANKYNILVEKEDFYEICKSVPNIKKAESNTAQEINIDNIDGHDFEYYCADILRKNGFENVEVTRGSGDHGIDILAEKNDITYAIQCKCYSSDINNAAVQQAYTGKGFYKKDIAVVLTNRYFTAQAKEEAEALGVKLWDRDKLNSMIERANK